MERVVGVERKYDRPASEKRSFGRPDECAHLWFCASSDYIHVRGRKGEVIRFIISE